MERIITSAGWSSLVARRAHNPKVGGSNPSPATTRKAFLQQCEEAFLMYFSAFFFRRENLMDAHYWYTNSKDN